MSHCSVNTNSTFKSCVRGAVASHTTTTGRGTGTGTGTRTGAGAGAGAGTTTTTTTGTQAPVQCLAPVILSLRSVRTVAIAVEMQFFRFPCATDHGDADQGWSARDQYDEIWNEMHILLLLVVQGVSGVAAS